MKHYKTSYSTKQTHTVTKVLLLLLFTAFQIDAIAQVVPTWYNDHKMAVEKVDFSKLVKKTANFSLIKVVDTVSIPEIVSIVVVNEQGKFLQELPFDLAAYCNSKDLILVGKKKQGRLLMGVTDLKGNIIIPLEFLKIRYAKNLFAVKNNASLWALFDHKGTEITDFIYTDLLFTAFGKVKTKDTKGTGILNEDGTSLLTNTFGEITQLSADSFLVKEQDTWAHLDVQKNIKFRWVADSLTALSAGLYCSYFEGRAFLKDSLGKIIGSENGYHKVEKLSSQFIKISLEEYSGLIDFLGNEILPLRYYDIQLDKAGYISALSDEVKALRYGDVVNKNKKRWSLFDTLGHKLLSKQYKSIRTFSEGMVALQTDDNLWGFANEKGAVIFDPKYSAVTDFKNGTTLVTLSRTKENDFLLLTKEAQKIYTGKEAQLFYLGVTRYRPCTDSARLEGEPDTELYYGVPPARYESYTLAEYGYIRVRNDPYTGILNPEGKEVVQAYQDTVYLASADTFFLYKRNNGLVGYADRYCNTTLSLTDKFEAVEAVQNGYSKFKKDGLYGFIDPFGNIQIAPKYSHCGNFSNGMCAVFLQGKWGFVDKVENLTVQPYYKEVNPFRNDFAPVKNSKNKWLFIDKNGTPLNSTQYDRFYETKNGKYGVVKNKMCGIADSKGKEILAPKYEQIEELSATLLKIKKDGKYGVMDYKENIILYPQYDKVVYNEFLGSFLVGTVGGSRKVSVSMGK